jgi:hypothetical protein
MEARFSEEQLVSILRQAQGDMTIKALRAKHNISETAPISASEQGEKRLR